MQEGWIKFYRQVRKNWLWPTARPYTELEAWIDILFSANFTSAKVLIVGTLVEIERGEFITSEVKLSQRWDWSRDRVRRFFALLKREEMCETIKTNHYSKVRVLNYEAYQGNETAPTLETTEIVDGSTTANKTVDDTADDTADDTQRRITKECEKDKEVYINIIDFLNGTCGTRFRATPSNTRHIQARINEGYTEADFQAVINKKSREWLGTEQAKYLRPQTLFGPKFDGYLNQLGGEKGGADQQRPGTTQGTNSGPAIPSRVRKAGQE